jgi:fructosamine-3-kinase
VSLPARSTDVEPVAGGDINEAYRLRLGDGRLAFVKTRSGALASEYESEAFGLRWLAEPGCLQVPEVLELGDGFLALEWVEHGRLDGAGMEELGRGLARLHTAGPARFGDPRGESEAVLGSLRLPNGPIDDWPEFYARRRLSPLLQIAIAQGALSEQAARAVKRVCERIVALAGPAEPPARLHGDLWSGNVLAGMDGRPWLIDPAAYGGHREVDLAMLRLFGAPSERVFDAYQELAPLGEGWEERVQLWQLLPLMVHAVLFGGSYGEAVRRVAVHYAGA